MSQSIFSGDFVDLSLGQLGASKIKTVNGQQHVVHFDLGEGKDLVYVFSVTNENRCYLQRARITAPSKMPGKAGSIRTLWTSPIKPSP